MKPASLSLFTYSPRQSKCISLQMSRFCRFILCGCSSPTILLPSPQRTTRCNICRYVQIRSLLRYLSSILLPEDSRLFPSALSFLDTPTTRVPQIILHILGTASKSCALLRHISLTASSTHKLLSSLSLSLSLSMPDYINSTFAIVVFPPAPCITRLGAVTPQII